MPDVWTMSNKLAFDPAWPPREWGALENAGWLEGNVVADPEGQLWDLLRFSAHARGVGSRLPGAHRGGGAAAEL